MDFGVVFVKIRDFGVVFGKFRKRKSCMAGKRNAEVRRSEVQSRPASFVTLQVQSGPEASASSVWPGEQRRAEEIFLNFY